MFGTIWNKYTVGTILVAPIFDSMVPKVFQKYSRLRYPFIQLVLECGLINAYLHTDFSEEEGIHFLFDREKVVSGFNKMETPYHSLNELLVDMKMFDCFTYMNNDFLIYRFKLPTKFSLDISLIQKGAYSRVSPEYKKLLKVTDKRIPDGSNEIARFITSKNLPYFVTTKQESLRLKMENFLQTKIPETHELFKAYNEDFETLKFRDINITVKEFA